MGKYKLTLVGMGGIAFAVEPQNLSRLSRLLLNEALVHQEAVPTCDAYLPKKKENNWNLWLFIDLREDLTSIDNLKLKLDNLGCQGSSYSKFGTFNVAKTYPDPDWSVLESGRRSTTPQVSTGLKYLSRKELAAIRGKCTKTISRWEKEVPLRYRPTPKGPQFLLDEVEEDLRKYDERKQALKDASKPAISTSSLSQARERKRGGVL